MNGLGDSSRARPPLLLFSFRLVCGGVRGVPPSPFFIWFDLTAGRVFCRVFF